MFVMLEESNRRLLQMLYERARWMAHHRARQWELERVRQAMVRQRVRGMIYPCPQPAMSR